jgi:hypothetical protein
LFILYYFSLILVFVFKILWKNRLQSRFLGSFSSIVTASVDGTDFQIEEPQPFSPVWYSHKFRGPGLRYEVTLSLEGSDIVYVNGPFPCSVPDINIYRSSLKNQLRDDELLIADKGYQGEDKIVLPGTGTALQNEAIKLIRARHETLNARLKNFGCLSSVWRHDLSKHRICFFSAVIITQLSLETRDTFLFPIDKKYLFAFP